MWTPFTAKVISLLLSKLHLKVCYIRSVHSRHYDNQQRNQQAIQRWLRELPVTTSCFLHPVMNVPEEEETNTCFALSNVSLHITWREYCISVSILYFQSCLHCHPRTLTGDEHSTLPLLCECFTMQTLWNPVWSQFISTDAQPVRLTLSKPAVNRAMWASQISVESHHT